MPFQANDDESGYVIKKVPVPTRRGRASAEIYPFASMRPGSEDSFDIKCKEGETTSAAGKARSNANRHNIGIMCRAVTPTTVRVWRVK